MSFTKAVWSPTPTRGTHIHPDNKYKMSEISPVWSTWRCVYVQHSVYRAHIRCKNTVLLVTWQVAQFQEDALVHFLCNPSHFGAHVTYEEEANGAGAHYDLGYPESRVPAVLFGDGAEGETCHKSPNCNKSNCFFWVNVGILQSESRMLWLVMSFCGLPFAISATTAWDVPQKFEGALSLAITPNKAMGP